MKIQHNISLKEFNTFGIDVKAKKYISITSVKKLKKVLNFEKDVFVLSGGSNLLFTKNPENLVIHLNTKGKKIKSLNKNEVLVTVQAGENWHNFVLWCIEQNFGGLENLSLIPGNTGTCPIQNIGAYGIEVKDFITKVETIEISTNKLKIFTNKQCKFKYRSSIFKNELRGKYILINVTFKLTKNRHKLNYTYGTIKEELTKKSIKKPSIQNISDAVIAIRNSKLPEPKKIGNSGSFFKNPVIPKLQFLELKKIYNTIPHYIISESKIKIPASWLIEKCGFKGKRYGHTGTYEKQPLVLVNHGNATGKEIYEFAKKIKLDILKKFSINLEIEVDII